ISSLFIPAGDSINIQLGFHPEVFGYFDGLLEVYSPVINARILLKGQSPYPVLTPINEQIIFNQTIIDSTSFKSFKFFNSSPSNDLRIDTLYLLIGENFSIISDNLPLIISPSDTGEIFLAFTPHTVGLKKDTLVICSNTEVNKYYFPLGGLGINPSGLISDEVFNYDNILFQNYPNPFNPVTNIQFSIKSQQNVSLIVFDVLGNEVTTLVDEEKPAGHYSVNFDGTKLSSGIYFYQLKAGDFTATKKLILLK
ncbi:MAG TPA: T9SS type A sorting domain-containing protein, partial [Ignavibacteriaceae bacterium]|nr:T9SS type A sorting domain-containing protein [Ignavibacteriaceae bacterium]